jgi:hypothetical protein
MDRKNIIFFLNTRVIPTHHALRNENIYYTQTIGFGKQECPLIPGSSTP